MSDCRAPGIELGVTASPAKVKITSNHCIIFYKTKASPVNSDYIPSVDTKQQSYLKNSQSLMSICLRLLSKHSADQPTAGKHGHFGGP